MAEKDLNLKMMIENAEARQSADALSAKLRQVDENLERIDKDGKRAGQGIKEGATEGGRAMQVAVGAASQLHQGMLAIQGAGMAIGAVRGVFSAINAELRNVSEFTKRVAEDFVQTQKAMQGISSLQSRPNNNAFTLEEAKKGAEANLKPEEWTAARNAFLSKASNYVGDKPNAILNEKESDKFQAKMFEFGKQKGVDSGEMASFAGGLLAQEKGPQTADAMLAKAGKVFATLEASSTDVKHLLPGMTEQMAGGLSAEQAAPLLAQMPEIAPGQESTYLRRTISELRQKTIEGKIGEEYGVKKGMGPQEMLEAVVGNLEDRNKRGEDMGEAILGITHEEVSGATLRGLAGKGRAGLKQWQGILQSTPDNAVETSIEEGRQTDAGKNMRAESRAALADIESGAKFAGVERLKKEARAELTRSGRFDSPHVEDVARNAIANLPFVGTGVSAKDQLINEKAYDKAFEQSGLPKSQRLGIAPGAAQAVVDDQIRKLLERSVALQEKQLALKERQVNGAQQGPGAPVVLVSPQARGGVRQ